MGTELTQLEQKVYDCVKRNDDGRGLPAAYYCMLFKTQGVPDISPGTTDGEFVDSLRKIEKYQAELNMTEEKCEQTLNSLVEKGYLKTYESLAGEALYTLNKSMAKQDAPEAASDSNEEARNRAASTVNAATNKLTLSADKFTFDQHLQGKGPDYTINIPDGLVFKEDPAGRDFIAYLPDGEEEEIGSSFVIYAGNKIENENLKNIRTVPGYISFTNALRTVFGNMPNMKVTPIEREDLPGALVYWTEHGCMHANAFVGVGDHMQGMRFQILGVDDRNQAKFETIVKELMDGMTTDTPVSLLKQLDADEFRQMTPGDPVSDEWKDLIGEYIEQFSVARNMDQDSIANRYKKAANNSARNFLAAILNGDEGNFNTGIDKKALYAELKEMLSRYSKYAETELLKTEKIYTELANNYPGDKNLNGLKDAINNLAAFANQEVNVDQDHLEVKSKTAAKVLKRLPLSPAEIEKKKKEEEERIRKAKAEEEKRKQEEIKRKDNIYNEAVALGAKKDSKSISKAIDKLKSIPGWKDSDALIDDYNKNLEKALEEEAEKERERLRIEELKKKYKDKYDPLKARKTENEKILDESLQKKEEREKKGGGGILLGWGAFQTILGAFVAIVTDSTLVGIVNVIFGVFIFWLGLGIRKNKRTELESLTKKIDDANAVLKEIEEIPTFDEFCYSLTDEGIEEARRKEEERITEIYKDAVDKAKSTDKDVLCEARDLLKSIADKRDVTKELAECENNILLADKQIAKKKRNKKIIIIVVVALVIMAALGLVINSNIQKKNKAAFEAELSAVNWYQFDDKGVPELMFDFDSDGTAELRSDLDVLENKWDDKDYFEWTVITANKDRAAFTVKMKDSDDPAISMIAEKGDEGNFDKISADDGSEEFVAMNKKDFDKIVEELANEENYKTACSLLDEGKLSEAYDLFSSMKDYKDSGEKATAIFEQIKENNTRFFELAQKAAETDLGSAGEYLDQISGYFAPAGELQKLYNRFSPYSGSFTLNNYLKDEIVSTFSLAPDGTIKWKATTKDGKAITIYSKEANCNTETAVKENYNGTNKYYAEFTYADKPAYAIFSNNKIEFYVVNTLRQNQQYYSYFAEKNNN